MKPFDQIWSPLLEIARGAATAADPSHHDLLKSSHTSKLRKNTEVYNFLKTHELPNEAPLRALLL